jgi:hypothetical protein
MASIFIFQGIQLSSLNGSILYNDEGVFPELSDIVDYYIE